MSAVLETSVAGAGPLAARQDPPPSTLSCHYCSKPIATYLDFTWGRLGWCAYHSAGWIRDWPAREFKEWWS